MSVNGSSNRARTVIDGGVERRALSSKATVDHRQSDKRAPLTAVLKNVREIESVFGREGAFEGHPERADSDHYHRADPARSPWTGQTAASERMAAALPVCAA